MNTKHYTHRVTWSPEDGEHVGLCAELPSLSWLAKTPEAALKGIQKIVADMLASDEAVSVALAEKRYSGEFRVRKRITHQMDTLGVNVYAECPSFIACSGHAFRCRKYA